MKKMMKRTQLQSVRKFILNNYLVVQLTGPLETEIDPLSFLKIETIHLLIEWVEELLQHKNQKDKLFLELTV